MRYNLIALTLTTALAAGMLTGCAPKLGGSDYDVAGAGEVSETKRGIIIAKRVIRLNAKQPNQPGAGGVMGAVGGGLLGSTIGQGKGRIIGGTLGALAGGIGGHFIEQGLTNQDGFEYQVQLTDNSVISIAQGGEPNLAVGQRVLVIKSQKSRGRIIADNS